MVEKGQPRTLVRPPLSVGEPGYPKAGHQMVLAVIPRAAF